MIKAGEKRKVPKEQIVAAFFSHPVTEKVCADLLTVDDASLRTLFKVGYDAIQAIGGEVTKAAVGLGDPEKLITLAGKDAPKAVRDLGMKIQQLAENT